jgi:phospholipid/cholesterol/gamma-HCH transport system permease protein
MISSPESAGNCSHDVIEEKDKHVVVKLAGNLNVATAVVCLRDLKRELDLKSPPSLIVDLGEVTGFDDYGALILIELRKFSARKKAHFKLINIPPKVNAILNLVKFDSSQKPPPATKKKPPNLFIRLGDAAITEAYNVRYMISFLGSVAICFMILLRRPRSLRLDDTIGIMQKTGVDAVPIVALISFLLGLIMAFVSSLQLQRFGAGVYVASLVALSMVSELGPIMTAIIVAGRTGSAFAAEIGTMRISEEIDALFSMGFSPTHFLALPRIIASVVVVPILTLFSILFAIMGGLLVSVSMLDLSMNTYISQTIEALSLFEVTWGLAKSIVFAGLIALVGCLRGFQVKGGASQVGNAATSAVVSSIFLIILVDSIFAVIRSYWG